jgi:hypothetical protein
LLISFLQAATWRSDLAAACGYENPAFQAADPKWETVPYHHL